MKAIIFDCDGVLINSEPLACQAWIETLKRYNIHTDKEEMMQFIGKNDRKVLAYFSEKAEFPLQESVLEENYNMYLKLAEESLEPMPKIQKVIAYVKEKNISYAIASSSAHERIRFSLTKTNLIPHFEIICSATEVQNAKPAPDLFLLAAKRLGVNPEDCIVIEDSLAGIEAAKAAGMKVFGYASSHSAHTLRQHGAHFVFEDYDDLLNNFQG